MARAVGIDIGERFLKIVELTGGPRAFRIQRVAVRELPGAGGKQAKGRGEGASDEIVIESDEDREVEAAPEPSREERISELIRGVFAEMKLPSEDVCAAFPSHGSVNREINVPFFEDDQIRKVVRFEAENHLHSRAIDDVVVNWVKTGETRDGSRLTIFASPKQDLAQHLALLRRARVDPASVDLDATALYTALDAMGVFNSHPNVIVLDMGANSTTLLLAIEGRLRVVRSFRLGVGGMDEEIGRDLELPAHEAGREAARLGRADGEDLLVPAAELVPAASETEKTATQLQTDIVSDHRRHFVTKLHREAIRSLASVSTDSPPDRLLLLGGGALHGGVAEDLETRFGLPVERLDLLEHVECRDRGPDPELAGATLGPAIGCGLRMLGRNPLGIELLQDEFAPRNMFEVLRTTLATGITLLFLVVGLWTYGLREQIRAEKLKYDDRAAIVEQVTYRAENAYQKHIENKTPDVADQIARTWVRSLAHDATRIDKMRNLLVRRHAFLQTELGMRSDIPQLYSAVKVWVEVYKAFSSVPREQLGTFFQVQALDIQERDATVTVVVDSREALDLLKRLLSQSPYFQERARYPATVVKPGSEQTLPGGHFRQRFTLEFREDD